MSFTSTDAVAGTLQADANPTAASPVWAWVMVGIYVLVVACGNGLLNDSDTFWQIAVGQSIIANGAMPHTDIYSFTRAGAPWTSSSWLAQVLYAQAYAMAGWSGVVALAAIAISAATGLLVRRLSRRMAPLYAATVGLVAVSLSMPHLLARPHVLVMPVMVAWVDGLVQASDAQRPPPPWLLALIALWANLHGSFVFGLALVGAFFIDAIWNASTSHRKTLAVKWIAFGCGAVVACCITPYGWGSFLAAAHILNLGGLLNIISEWRPADFSHVGAFEVCLLGLLATVLYCGISFSWPRILIVLGLVGMALSHQRNIELFALLLPLVVITPLALRFPHLAQATEGRRRQTSPAILVLLGVLGGGAGAVVAHAHPATPAANQSPAAAVDVLIKSGAKRILNDLPFGGYLIWRKIPVFIDGRAELYGERFGLNYYNALELKDVDQFLTLLKTNDIDATILTSNTPAAKLLNHLPGWKRIYADNFAIVHVRSAIATKTQSQH